MTVQQMIDKFSLSPLCVPQPERVVNGGYIGDLLSWVMGRASQDNAWITIMSNVNIVAVASLADVSMIILAEGVKVDENVIETAFSKGVNIVSTQLSAYEIAVQISQSI